MNKFEQILTREQLENEIQNILYDEVTFHIWDEYDAGVEYGDSVKKICDLIADLPNMCFHDRT